MMINIVFVLYIPIPICVVGAEELLMLLCVCYRIKEDSRYILNFRAHPQSCSQPLHPSDASPPPQHALNLTKFASSICTFLIVGHRFLCCPFMHISVLTMRWSLLNKYPNIYYSLTPINLLKTFSEQQTSAGRKKQSKPTRAWECGGSGVIPRGFGGREWVARGAPSTCLRGIMYLICLCQKVENNMQWLHIPNLPRPCSHRVHSIFVFYTQDIGSP